MAKVYYSQADSRWASHPYTGPNGQNSNKTVKSSGCGPTCAAMVVSSCKETITPDKMCDYSKSWGCRASSGTATSLFPKVGSKWGIEHKSLNSAQATLDACKNGWFVVLLCHQGLFCNGGHFVLAVGADGDKIQIYDPYYYSSKIERWNKSGQVTKSGDSAWVTVSNLRNYGNVIAYDAFNVQNTSFEPSTDGDSDLGPSDDRGGWSIGLIQWHEVRAYDLCYNVAKYDANWESQFTSNNIGLRSALKESIQVQSTNHQRDKFKDYHPIAGTNTYNSIQNLIGSDMGKKVQLALAQADTKTALMKLQSSPYSLKNPCTTIFLLDIMNQYGNGINNSSEQPKLKGCLDKAVKIEKDYKDKSDLEQLDLFWSYWKDVTATKTDSGQTTYAYNDRRQTTYNYIKGLYDAGKLSEAALTDVNGASGTIIKGGVVGNLGFIFPVEGCGRANVSSNSANNYPSYKGHTGVDIGIGVANKNVLAVADGTVIASKALKNSNGSYYSYGEYIAIDHGNGYCTAYAHMVPNSRKVSVGAKVKQGQVLGQVGETGNAQGVHLHFELRKGSNQLYNTNAIDPRKSIGII